MTADIDGPAVRSSVLPLNPDIGTNAFNIIWRSYEFAVTRSNCGYFQSNGGTISKFDICPFKIRSRVPGILRYLLPQPPACIALVEK